MKVFGYTPQGREQRKPLSDRKAIGLSSSGSVTPDPVNYSLETGGYMMHKQHGKYLPPAPPAREVRISNGECSVYLDWEELENAYKFASRERENRLREEFNTQHGLKEQNLREQNS